MTTSTTPDHIHSSFQSYLTSLGLHHLNKLKNHKHIYGLVHRVTGICVHWQKRNQMWA